MAEKYIYAVVLGISLGLLLDIFRLFRLLLKDKFFFDFIFWVISALCVFSYFIVFSSGEIRTGYIIIIFSAAVFYVLTVGKLTGKAEIFISKRIHFAAEKIKKQLKSVCTLYYNKWVKRKNFKTAEDKGEVYDRKGEKKERK